MKTTDLYEKFIEKLKRKESMEFIFIKCPFLINNLCSIYDQRMSCCRNFPNKKGICADYDCKLLDGNSDKEICDECNNKCCGRIIYPKNLKFNLDFFIDILNMDCETCTKLFTDYDVEK